MSHYAKTLLDASDTDAHLSSSQAECERSAGNLRPSGHVRMCPVMFDGWLCWPPTLAGSVIKQPCPAIYQFNVNQFAYRKCMPNGTWYGVMDPSRPDDSGWSNYTMCVLQSAGNGAIIPPPGHYDVTSAVYNPTQSGSQDDVAGSFVSLPTSPMPHSFDAMNNHDIMPVDDVIGSVLHGISAACLLLALVTWVTLKLTDRLVTRRYLVLLATIVMASLFHTIVLTSRLRAVALALGETSGTHGGSSTSAPVRPQPVHSTFRPPGLGYDPAPTAGSGAKTLNAEDDGFRFYDPYAYVAPPPGNQFSASASKRGGQKQSGVSGDRKYYDRDLDDISSQMFLRTISKRSRDGGGTKDKNHHGNREPNSRKSGDSGSKKGRNSRKGRRKSRKGGNKNRKEAHVGNRNNGGNNDGEVGGDNEEDVVAVNGEQEQQQQYDAGLGIAGIEDFEGMGDGERGRKKNVGGPWVTLCQVGRAFYLLTDMSTYSFLLAVSLYYTLVVLASDLTFNRLVGMFVLGLATPVFFVTLTILLYTFLADDVLDQHNSFQRTTSSAAAVVAAAAARHGHDAGSSTGGGGGFGSSCIVDALGDELHWAVTGPKLICVVLSLCLMTVSTYGFWRLHVPALNASSETFYARQGVLKTLALLLCCSLAELLWMVTEYQKIYGWTTSRYLLYASTAAQGAKGTLLAFLFCFVDCEVLHGTCCPPSNSDGEPWLTAGTARDGEAGDGEEKWRGVDGGGGGGGKQWGKGGGGEHANSRGGGGGGSVGNNLEMGDVPPWSQNHGKQHRDIIGAMDFNEKM